MKSTLVFSMIIFISAGCMEQYNPRPYWKRHEEERIIAHAELPKLTAEGKLPAMGEGGKVKLSAIDEKFETFCVTCHGADGKAETDAAKALNPRPRSFTDKKWQASVTDDHIEQVIRKGGAANGLSAKMAAWEAMLPGDLPKKMVEKVRSFGK